MKFIETLFNTDGSPKMPMLQVFEKLLKQLKLDYDTNNVYEFTEIKLQLDDIVTIIDCDSTKDYAASKYKDFLKTISEDFMSRVLDKINDLIRTENEDLDAQQIEGGANV